MSEGMERFGSNGVRDLFNGNDSKAARRTISQKAAERARRKVQEVVAASSLADLSLIPNNRLEKHTEGGKYQGYHSIRVNDQYRVLFVWTDAGAFGIVIDDYHNKK
jgi:proteic killer suppression protein